MLLSLSLSLTQSISILIQYRDILLCPYHSTYQSIIKTPFCQVVGVQTNFARWLGDR